MQKMALDSGKVQILVADALKVDAVEEAFNDFLVRHEEKGTRFNSLEKSLTSLLSEGQAESQDVVLQQFVSVISTVSNSVHSKLLFGLLENLVSNNIVNSRKVCETLLQNENLNISHPLFWRASFSLIQKIVSNVDYKGVREIMKTCLEKAQGKEIAKTSLEKAQSKEKSEGLPTSFSSSELANVTALEQALKHILDRQTCLLPAYFIVNEIRKMYPENKDWPHWKLAVLLSGVVDSFRPLVQILSPIGRPLMFPVVDPSSHGVHHSWKLEQGTLKLALKGNLPYDKEYMEPQTRLIRYVLEQPYSREVLCGMLGLQKQHKTRHVVLEEQLVELLVQAMERAETAPEPDPDTSEELGVSHWLWHHLSSQIIYFVLFQFASFSHLVTLLHEKLAERKLRKGRDQLMWVLLQYISGSIQKNPLAEFLPLLRLYDLLYPERDPLPVPDYTRPICVHQMAVACIWIHIVKKAQTEQQNAQKEIAAAANAAAAAPAAGATTTPTAPSSTPKTESRSFTTLLQKHFPKALKSHQEFLLQNAHNPPSSAPSGDYRVALLCNAFSTTLDCLARPMGSLMESLHGNLNQKSSGGSGSSGSMPISPIPLAFLDALTVHAKMSLIHSIVTHVIKCAQTKMNSPLAPALVETYSRLLVYTEIESLGIKGFITQVMTSVSKSQAWGIFHTLVEMFTFRVHHMQPQYRIQLLTLLHSCAVPQQHQNQLTLCVENAALRLIGLLGAAEMQPCYTRPAADIKPLFSSDSEELNRALILTLARVISVAGCEPPHSNWYKETLTFMQQQTPHSWSTNTRDCFPPPLAEFFGQPLNQPPAKESKQQLKVAIEEEHRKVLAMNPDDWPAHFAGAQPNNQHFFLCLLWKQLLETERINPAAYSVIERIGARGLGSHLRTFCDFLVYEFANSGKGQHVNKCIDVLNEMVWSYNIVTIERLVLCLALRPLEGNEAQVCCFIIQLLLLKTPQFRSRVQDFVKDNSSEHWKQNNWHEKHLAFQRKFPERFGPPDSVLELIGQSGSHQPLPTYFGNVCLRFLPVFDITIHRFIEIPPVTKSLETILEHLGCLYKFHNRPVTYLYTTLHYYEKKLRDRALLKRKLVSSIMGSLKEVRPAGWALTEAYLTYSNRAPDDLHWQPDLDYYVKLVGRLVDTTAGHSTSPFPAMDWRFNEFPNASCHALYVTAVELLALPAPPTIVAKALMDVVLQGYNLLPITESAPLESWINAVGLLLTYLPESYWTVLYDRIVDLLSGPQLSAYTHPCSPLQLFHFPTVIGQGLDAPFVLLLAVAHAFFTHANIGQMGGLPQFVKDRLHPLIRTEEQYLWLCHLIGPTLQRFSVSDKPKIVFDLTVELYELLEQVDKNVPEIKLIDPICDLFFHIKYMFTGDTVKTEVEQVIRNLKPPLRLRLRFISHLSPQ